jgi:hypothetical protein
MFERSILPKLNEMPRGYGLNVAKKCPVAGDL